MNNQSIHFRAYAALITAGFGWSITPIFIRLTHDVFDPYTLSLYRYMAALVPLLIVSVAFFRKDLVAALRSPMTMVPLGLVLSLQQYTWIVGLDTVSATTAHLLIKLSVVFIIMISFFAFREERSVIRSPRYIVGTALSFLGVSAVLSNGAVPFAPVLNFGSVMVLATAVLWAVYSVLGKHSVKHIHPIPMYTVLSLYTALTYAGFSVRFGQPLMALDFDAKLVFWTIVVGVVPLAIGHPLFHYAQKQLGSSYCATFNLFTPLITYVISLVLLPNESLTMTQCVGAALLLGGTFSVTMASMRTQAQPEALELPAGAMAATQQES